MGVETDFLMVFGVIGGAVLLAKGVGKVSLFSLSLLFFFPLLSYFSFFLDLCLVFSSPPFLFFFLLSHQGREALNSFSLSLNESYIDFEEQYGRYFNVFLPVFLGVLM